MIECERGSTTDALNARPVADLLSRHQRDNPIGWDSESPSCGARHHEGAVVARVGRTADCLDKSSMLRAALGDAVVDHYVHTAKWEQFEYDRRITDWELHRGFERY